MRSASPYKEEIFKLFAEGYSVAALENRVEVTRRTLYRWYSEFLETAGEIPELKNNKLDNPVVEEIKEAVNAEIETTEIDDQELSNKEWQNLALKKSVTGCLRNSLIASKLSDRLLVELEKEEVNLRAIATFSNAINLHSRLEQSYGQYQLLTNPNLAIQVLEKEGYIISPPRTIDIDAD